MPPHGVTLIELLLVLVLLTVIGSLAAPIVENSFITAKLRRGGDRVLAAWTRARTVAIESGEVMQFLYKPDGGEFRIAPWSLAESPAAGGVKATATAPAPLGGLAPQTSQSAAASEGALKPVEETGALPEDIHFHAGQILAVRPDDREREITSLSPHGEAWSTPVLFFPDGTTSDAAVTLATNRRQYQRVTLRGLTGVGRSSLVFGQTELQRLDSAQRSVR